MSRIITEKLNKILKREYTLRFFSFLFMIFSLIIFMTIIFVSPSYLLLHLYQKAYELNNSTTKNIELAKMQENKNTKIDDLSSLVRKIPNEDEEKYFVVSKLLINDTQNYISVNTLELSEISEGKLKINLVGNATNRENLLTFQSIINKNPSFKNFSIPIEVLAKQKDISFNLTFEYHEN